MSVPYAHATSDRLWHLLFLASEPPRDEEYTHLAKNNGQRKSECEPAQWGAGRPNQSSSRKSRRYDGSYEDHRQRRKRDLTGARNFPDVDRREAQQEKQQPNRDPKRKAIDCRSSQRRLSHCLGSMHNDEAERRGRAQSPNERTESRSSTSSWLSEDAIGDHSNRLPNSYGRLGQLRHSARTITAPPINRSPIENAPRIPHVSRNCVHEYVADPTIKIHREMKQSRAASSMRQRLPWADTSSPLVGRQLAAKTGPNVRIGSVD